MDILLDSIEVRILGCLIEKEMTTPEYYPLSLNSLTNACNQKSNRNPVASHEESSVEQGLESLQKIGLARRTFTAGSRVPKFLHTLLDRFDLSKQESAVLCELMLRGPQTAAELRSHAERLCAFESLETIVVAVQGLIDHEPPLTVLLPRETGRKERRYMHLFSGGVVEQDPQSAESRLPAPCDRDRIKELEEQVASLRKEIEDLKNAFDEFRAAF